MTETRQTRETRPPRRGGAPAPRPRHDPSPEFSLAPIGSAQPTRMTVAWEAEPDAYLFQSDTEEYRLVVGPPDEQSPVLRVEGRLPGGEWHVLLRGAGMMLREGEGAVLPPSASQGRLELLELRHSARGRIVSVRYTERFNGRDLKRSLQVRPCGRCLEIRVEAAGADREGGYCGFSLGALGPGDARPVAIPGLPDPLLVFPEGAFLAAYPDRLGGAASAYPPGGAFYRLDTEGRSAPIDETFFVTLSANPLDPLPALPRPAPPHLAALRSRITLDFHSTAPYAEDERLIRLLAAYGLRDILLVYRNWQYFGYNRRGPLFYPANPERGSSEAFRRMLNAARECGWLVALRQEYASVAHDSPYWDERDLARWWDGAPRLTRREEHFAVAGDRMQELARLEATKIRRNYPARAVFVDGHTAWTPEGGLRQVDSRAGSRCMSEAQAVRRTEALLAFLRDVFGGPVVGAGGEGPHRFDTFAQGLADGVLRGPEGGPQAPLVVDYELRQVAPKLVGIGAGSPAAYRRSGGGGEDPFDLDAYRATEVALGHAGYLRLEGGRIGGRGPALPGPGIREAVREYYLLRALQELSLAAAVQSVAYWNGEALVGLREALVEGLDLSQARIAVELAGGLSLWVNRSSRDRWTVEAEGTAYELPPGGFLAVATRGRLLAYSALVAGKRLDYCRSAAYTFLDARAPSARFVEDVSVDGSVVLRKSEVAGRPDVLLVGARQLRVGDAEYALSERADVRITHLSAEELELAVLDTESGKPVHVTLPPFSPSWSEAKLEVLELEAGAPRPSRCQVEQTRSGPQLARARPGETYRIRIPSPAPPAGGRRGGG